MRNTNVESEFLSRFALCANKRPIAQTELELVVFFVKDEPGWSLHCFYPYPQKNL